MENAYYVPEDEIQTLTIVDDMPFVAEITEINFTETRRPVATIMCGDIVMGYLHMFRKSGFQVSESRDGCVNLGSSSPMNLQDTLKSDRIGYVGMHELLKGQALIAIDNFIELGMIRFNSKAKADNNVLSDGFAQTGYHEYSWLDKFIDETIIWFEN